MTLARIPQDKELLYNLYNAFNPSKPLPAGDKAYVDCHEVRGDGDIITNLGAKIERSNETTYQLYAGHRGGGKSTELLRLKQYLKEQKFFIVYFEADAEDIEPEDAQYTDILLACTRHLLEQLDANPKPLLEWLKDRWQDLKDLAQTEVKLENIKIETAITVFAKLTANIRAVPNLRHEIRQKVNPHTVTLIKALNEYIDDAKNKLPDPYTDIVIIADNLDRMVPVIQEHGRTNHEDIFIDRCEQLKSLNCHVIYTVPLSMVYSKRSIEIADIYGTPEILPMIMVQTRTGDIYQPGMDTMKEVISKRVKLHDPQIFLEQEVFENSEILEGLCKMSGGDMRNLILLTQVAIHRTQTLPISKRAVQRSISELRTAYRKTVEHDQWRILAEVSQTKTINNDNQYRQLLFNRCILEYCDLDEEQEMQHWYDVHPLIRGIQEFKQAVTEWNNNEK